MIDLPVGCGSMHHQPGIVKKRSPRGGIMQTTEYTTPVMIAKFFYAIPSPEPFKDRESLDRQDFTVAIYAR